jgi:hypothetical protein
MNARLGEEDSTVYVRTTNLRVGRSNRSGRATFFINHQDKCNAEIEPVDFATISAFKAGLRIAEKSMVFESANRSQTGNAPWLTRAGQGVAAFS